MVLMKWSGRFDAERETSICLPKFRSNIYDFMICIMTLMECIRRLPLVSLPLASRDPQVSCLKLF